jgi:hypothetical protein
MSLRSLQTQFSECSSTQAGLSSNLSLQQHSANAAQNAAKSANVPPVVHEVLRSPGQPLDSGTRTRMESDFGHDFSQVRVHLDAKAAASADAVEALAYTVQQNIVFGAGQYAPDTATGRKLLTHELTHVVQQSPNSTAPHSIELSQPNSAAEAEANRHADAIGNDHAARSIQPTQVQVARQPQPSSSKTPSRSTPKDQAKQKHEYEQTRIAALIQQGLKTLPRSTDPSDRDTLFRNSCEWIAAGQSTLVILTPTHDARTRKPGSIAYFDRQVEYPQTGGDYADAPSAADQDHIVYAPPGWQGGMQANEFSLIDPAAQSDQQLQATFIHEVQHAADQTFWGTAAQPPPGRVSGSPGLTGSAALISAGLYDNYQSEFRSYWIEQPEGSPINNFGSAQQPATNAKPVTWIDPKSNQTFSRGTSFKNERQEKIFWHLVNNYDSLNIPETYTQDAAYRNMVDTFSQPVGVNLVNSTRIQALTDALQACKPTMDGSASPVREVFNKADGLDETDFNFLNNPSSAQPFWALATQVLSLQLFLQLQKRLIRLPIGDFPPDPAWTKPPGNRALV